jgi:hypothetical protein
MFPDEIDAINTAWQTANGSGIRQSVVARAVNAMYGLPAGKHGDNPNEARNDKGDVGLPKMFRRLVGFREDAKGQATLEAFLAVPSKKKDRVIDYGDFKNLTVEQRLFPEKNHVPMVPFNTLVTNGNRLDGKPEAMIFVEEAAALKNGTGKVTSWTEHGKPVATIPGNGTGSTSTKAKRLGTTRPVARGERKRARRTRRGG